MDKSDAYTRVTLLNRLSRSNSPFHFLGLEQCEQRYCLSTISYATHSVDCCAPDGAQSAVTADLDGDGDVDVAYVDYSGTIGWYRNIDGTTAFAFEQVVTEDPKDQDEVIAQNSSEIALGDIDGDGDIDLVHAFAYAYATNGAIVWYENINGRGGFGSRKTIAQSIGGTKSVVPVDIDGDGNIDILAGGSTGLQWYQNINGKGSFSGQKELSDSAWISTIATADLDNDGDLDVLAGSDRSRWIAWYENMDSSGTFSGRHTIDEGISTVSVTIADIDGDGDLDLISAPSDEDEKFVWYEQVGGDNRFGAQHVIARPPSGENTVVAGDVDGDGDVDLLSIVNGVGWYENIDGKGAFVFRQTMGGRLDHHSVEVADGDGDLDVVSVSGIFFYHDTIAWYENTDGRGNFGARQFVSSRTARSGSVVIEDLDGDGDLDLFGKPAPDTIAWYENLDGSGVFGPQRVVDRLDNQDNPWAWSGISVASSDVDGDGDWDLVVVSRDGNQDFWYENLDGMGHFGLRQPLQRFLRLFGDEVEDLDGDGDDDIVSSLSGYGGGIVWHEQRLLGDANDDGNFDSSDLVRVFQMAEYQDGIANNSTYDEGDWNQDGDFDSSDLVAAFQEDHYIAAARPLEAEIAAAVDWLFAKDEDAKESRAFVA